MWLFLGILFILGFIHTVHSISLLAKKRHQLIYAALVSAAILMFFPLSAKMNLQTAFQFLSDFNALSAACAFQAFESIGMMLLSFLLIKSRYAGRNRMMTQSLVLAPSGIFLAGLFLMQTSLFHAIERISFFLIALGFAVGVFTVLILSAAALDKWIKVWEWKMESKIALSFLQILLAAFLPLVIVGANIGQSHFEIPVKQTMVVLLTMTGFCGLGFLRQKRLLKKG
ncbi:MAG: hypothetical protein HYS56_00715 [Candidatus Omnitrophica bacterium]|nr:hypothetical protein [Candidatus Omnitrophota bacterium]